MKLLIIILAVLSQNAFSLEFFSNQVKDSSIRISGHASFGDLNGDGYNDIFVSGLYYSDYYCHPFTFYCDFPGEITGPTKVLLNDRVGGFYPVNFEFIETNLPVLEPSYRVEINYFKTTIADVNNDGFNDVVASDGRILLNDGSGQFWSQVEVSIGAGRGSIYAIDFDNDGVLEIFNEGKIRTRIESNPLAYETDDSFVIDDSLSVEFADFNNDEFVDIISYGNDSVVTIYLNNQSGKFSKNTKLELGVIENNALLIGDVNHDSKIDIILSNKSIFFNQGDMIFQNIENSIFLSENSNYLLMKLTNYNDDEYPDLIVKDNKQYSVYALFNDGDGKFGYPSSDAIGSKPITDSFYNKYFALISDFNNDGVDDYLADANYDSYYERSYIFQFNNKVALIDPVISFVLELHLTNPYVAHNGISGNKSWADFTYVPIDINGDGKKEYLSVYSYNQFNNSKELSFTRDRFNFSSWGFNPHYLSNVSSEGFDVNEIEIFGDDMNNFQSFISGDLNGDGLEDLLVTYADCAEQCDIPKSRIYYNSSSGLSTANKLDLNLGFINNATIADFDGNGSNEIIQLFSESENSGNFYQLRIIEVDSSSQNIEFHDISLEGLGSLFTLKDINNDEIVDVVFLNANGIPTVIFGDSNISTLSDQVKLVSGQVYDYRLIDADKDGDFDLFAFTSDFQKITYYENNGRGEYNIEKISGLRELDHIGRIEISDFNGDGEFEVIYLTYFNGLKIYELDNEGNYTNLIYTYKGESYSEVNSFSLIDDIDDDGQSEIIYNDSIIFSREFKFPTGLLYDKEHSGHGFSLENVGEEQFFTVFYTYDNDGNPEWYTNLGIFEADREDYWNIMSDDSYSLVRTEYDYANNIAIQNTSNSYKGSLSQNNCSSIYGKVNLHYEIGINGFGIPLTQGNWCSQPIVDHYSQPIEDFSGLWWAGDDDSGWGWSISLLEREDTTDMVLVLYYYDTQGNPRWLIGQQSGFVKGQEITLDMDMVKGYSRQSTPIDLTLIPAGTISITLNEASHSLARAGVMSIDVTYPGPEGGNWIRNNIPIAMFSEPR